MRAAVLLLAFIFALPFWCYGQGPAPETFLSFADHLYDQGDYYRAITEYERFVFTVPAHPLAKTARYRIALCYFNGEKYSQAEQRFAALSREFQGDTIGKQAQLMLAETFFRKKDYLPAISTLVSFLNAYPDDPQADEARIKIGWYYLRQGNWQRAADQFHGLPQGSPLRQQALDMAEDANKYAGLPHRSPVFAGALSAFLPGAGQLYVGRPGDATVAFFLNGIFIAATAEQFRRTDYVTGGILLFFESGWYLGNIYNAVSSAHKYNRRSEQEYIDTLRGRYGLSFYRDEQGDNLLALSLRF